MFATKNVQEVLNDSTIWDIFIFIALLLNPVITFSLIPQIYCETSFLSWALRNFKYAMSAHKCFQEFQGFHDGESCSEPRIIYNVKSRSWATTVLLQATRIPLKSFHQLHRGWVICWIRSKMREEKRQTLSELVGIGFQFMVAMLFVLFRGNLHFGGRFLDDHPKFVVILFFHQPLV